MVLSSEQAPFTSEIVGLILTTDSCEKSQSTLQMLKVVAFLQTGWVRINTGAPEPQGQRGQLPLLPKHCGGNRLPFLPELHLEICALFTGIGV